MVPSFLKLPILLVLFKAVMLPVLLPLKEPLLIMLPAFPELMKLVKVAPLLFIKPSFNVPSFLKLVILPVLLTWLVMIPPLALVRLVMFLVLLKDAMVPVLVALPKFPLLVRLPRFEALLKLLKVALLAFSNPPFKLPLFANVPMVP